MNDYISEFSAAMAADGLTGFRTITANGRVQRFVPSHKKNKRDKDGWYVLHIKPTYAHGAYGVGAETWGKYPGKDFFKKFTPEERARFAEERKLEAAALDLERQKNEAAAAKTAQWRLNHAECRNDHPYLVRKKLNIEMPIYKGGLLISFTNMSGVVRTLETIDADGGKKFLFQGERKGMFHRIGTDESRFIFCEGWATGQSIHDAGVAGSVIVTGDTGNLLKVAKLFRKKYIKAEFLFAADDDAATDGNPGVKAAQAAALDTGGRVILPQRADQHTAPPGSFDFSDMWMEGRGQDILACFGADVAEYVDDDRQWHDDAPEPKALPFTILGFDDGRYYYLPKMESQIVELTASGHSLSNLLRLAPYEYWEDRFLQGRDAPTKMALKAQQALMTACQLRGVFRPEISVRGNGGWLDEGRAVFNSGDYLWVNGERHALYNFKSKFTYVRSLNIGEPLEALTSAEAYKLREICEMPSWENKLSGSLLAGWIVIAPVCAMLKWRPHVWITGQAEAGKTTVLGIVRETLGQRMIKVDGGTTEPGLRQSIKWDGLPVLFDEAEGESDKAKSQMEDVMQFVRKSSSGGYVLKGSATGQASRFPCRSAFCFSAITPPVKHFADETRLTWMVIKKNTAPDAMDRYLELLSKIKQTITPEFGLRLLGRTMDNLPVLLDNIDTFTIAAAELLGSRRAADQIAPMLAGLYLLSKTNKITVDAARAWIAQHNWTFHTAISEMKDHDRLIQYISTRMLRVTVSGQQKDVTIGNLILCAARKLNICSDDEADRALRSTGIMIKNDRVIFANVCATLSDKLKSTTWSSKYSGTLSNIDGAIKTDNQYFAPGLKSKAVSIPLSVFSDGSQLPLDYDNEEEIKW